MCTRAGLEKSEIPVARLEGKQSTLALVEISRKLKSSCTF
jgi:hypothetical protein